jgi:hypothetical protein
MEATEDPRLSERLSDPLAERYFWQYPRSTAGHKELIRAGLLETFRSFGWKAERVRQLLRITHVCHVTVVVALRRTGLT